MGRFIEPPVVTDDVPETYPDEDYGRFRRNYTPSQVILPYRPEEAPAWTKQPAAIPKPARFQKLQRWDERAERFASIAQWTIFVAGAASLAPAVANLIH